jgi:hypothetical protein
MVNWLFRNRRTGRITIAQRPNAALTVWIAATAVSIAFDPAGWVGTALTVAGRVALVVWAGDELLRGVNPFRRSLGAAVLVWQGVDLLSR